MIFIDAVLLDELLLISPGGCIGGYDCVINKLSLAVETTRVTWGLIQSSIKATLLILNTYIF